MSEATKRPWKVMAPSFGSLMIGVDHDDKTRVLATVMDSWVKYGEKGPEPCDEYHEEGFANAALIVRAVNHFDAMKDSLKWFMGQLESGMLVRDISHDAGWSAIKMMEFVNGLNKVNAVMKAIESEEP